MSNPWRFPIALMSVFALLPAIVLPPSDRFMYTLGFTLLYISFGTMLLLSIYKETDRPRPKPGFATRALAGMGVFSYTLYLWHVPMAQAFSSLAPRFAHVNEYVLHAIYFTASIAVGILASKLVELPILKMRERLFPAPALGVDSRPSYAAETNSAAVVRETPAVNA
jgi:peptidoglycan/LPS O-acetylase OafA/YrhL